MDSSLHRKLTLIVASFIVPSAILGGVSMLVWRHGQGWLPLSLLSATPFASFLVPGLLLLVVVGGSSVACLVAVVLRSRFAVDLTLLAGGAMTCFIAAELVLLPLSMLHLFYGAAGLMLLVLGLLAKRDARQRWVVLVTAAEGLGFLGPVVVMFVLPQATGLLQVLLAGVAGLVEGSCLGFGQARGLRLTRGRWPFVIATALSASLVWMAIVSAMSLLPPVFSLLVGAAALFVMGLAQWGVLRRETATRPRWIGWTALAWLVALPLSFAPSGLVDAQTPMHVSVVLFGIAGLLMAYVMANVTWLGARA